MSLDLIESLLPLLQTIIETKEERISRGHPVGQDVPYAAMGGITGFSSLMDGYMRLDDSGIGPPPIHILEQPVGRYWVIASIKRKNSDSSCFPTSFLTLFVSSRTS